MIILEFEKESKHQKAVTELMADGLLALRVAISTEGNTSLRDLRRNCASSTGIAEDIDFLQELFRLCVSGMEVIGVVGFVQSLIRLCASGLLSGGNVLRSVGQTRFIVSTCTFLEGLLDRMLLKKEEIIFVSRITREIEFKGYLL